MIELILRIYLLFLFLQSCHVVDVNYIDTESVRVDPKEETELEESRRIGDETVVLDTNTYSEVKETSVVPKIGDDSDDDVEVDGDIDIHFPSETTTDLTTAPTYTTSESCAPESVMVADRIGTTEKRKPINVKELMYDNDYELPLESLRQIKNTSLTNKPNFGNSSKDNKSVYTEFFNLEPASGLFHYKGPVPFLNNFNTWYVPERYPCWDLPLLYGELGQKLTSDEVFLINPVKLKTVFDENLPPKTLQKTPQSEIQINKWCTVSPCFGDHTLCLYPGAQKSQICDGNYVVQTPTTGEHIALVNTLNTIRNHVAKGAGDKYPYLPPAANMKQVLYDLDLEQMSAAWLYQCLPGPAPCSALDSSFVTELECTKYSENCCYNSSPDMDSDSSCKPHQECFLEPIIGCIHTWFWSARYFIDVTDIKCGHVKSSTYSTVQLIWANTNKIGCAYGKRENGDIRVVCNFAPGAPYMLRTKFFCGILAHKDITSLAEIQNNTLITDLDFLNSIGIHLDPINKQIINDMNESVSMKERIWAHNLSTANFWGVFSLRKIYRHNWARQILTNFTNGTVGMIARLVTRYQFVEETQAKCDRDEPIYVIGPAGSLCVNTGRKFFALCYEFREPTPGYRLVAVMAPVALFSLILYDLLSGVMRQTHHV